jgi:uncharacterized protein YndB with AHSA1/START domain
VSRKFDIRKEIELDASPDEVWDAIATGPGLGSWFFPMEVEPREGGKITITVGDQTDDSAVVTVWDPPRRFTSVSGPEGAQQAFEFLVEGRDGGSTVLRFAQHGFLGDEWESQYDSQSLGWDMYFHTLGQYLAHFRGRRATFVSAEGPPDSGGDEGWAKLLDGLGLPRDPAEGASVRLTPAGLPPFDGVLDYVRQPFLGVRTADALFRFHGRELTEQPIGVGHHLFADDVDKKEHDEVWRSWLHRVF